MSDLIKFEGWDLDTTGDEPRVRDIAIGEHGGLARPRDIRRLIETHWDELTAHGEIRVCAQSARNKQGRVSANEYWLNEDQSVAITAHMRTKVGVQARVALVKLYGAWRRGQVVPPVTVDLNMVHGPTVGQVPDLRADVVEECQLTVRAAKLSLSRVHGVIRQIYRVPSIYFLSTLEWPNAKRTLRALALGKLHVKVPAPPKQLPADRRQVEMFGAN